MSPRFPSKNKLTGLVACAVLALTVLSAQAADAPMPKGQAFEPPAANEVVVSDRDWNHFLFPEKVVRGPYFPDSAPIPPGSKPVWLAGNTQFLLQIQRGAGDRFQMVVETESGAVHKLYLKPSPVAGTTFRVKGGSLAATAARAAAAPQAAPAGRSEDVDLLKRLVIGDIPADMETVKLPVPVRFASFTAVPMAMWEGGGRRVAVFNLVAVGDKASTVAPPQFYRPGVTAVLLDGDQVAPGVAPTLFVLENMTDE